MFDRAGHICPAHNENYFLLLWELHEFPTNGKEFFSTKYVSSSKVFGGKIHLDIFSPDPLNITHILFSQYLVSNVFWIRPMAIALQIGYRCIATTPCLSAQQPSGCHLCQYTSYPPPCSSPPTHVLYPLSPFFSMAFVV